MGKRQPFKEDQIREATGKVYHEWLTCETLIEWDAFHAFLQSIDLNVDHIQAVKKVFASLSDASSKIGAYMRQHDHREFETPCHLGMNMLKLKAVLKRFEADTNDKSNGWSSNPANFMLYYQMWTLAGVRVWNEGGESHAGATKRKSRDVSDESHIQCVVYLITNFNECNALGLPMRYVGRTVSFDRRMKQHQRVKSGCPLMRRAIQKYGLYGNGASLPMTTEILVAGSLEDMRWCETEYIRQYGTLDPHGYNLKAGDTAGLERADASKLVCLDHVFKLEQVDPRLQLEFGQVMIDDIRHILDAKEDAPPLRLEEGLS